MTGTAHDRDGGAAKRTRPCGKRRCVFWFAVLCYLAGLPAANAAERCDPWVAQAASIQGQVERRFAGTQQWQAVQRSDGFCEGDEVRVRDNSRAALTLDNHTILRLDQNSAITFTGLQADQPAWLDLVQGVAHFISRVKQSFKVVTPFVNAFVEGTEFVVEVRDQATLLTVFEGQVAARNARGEVVLGDGQAALATASQAPVLQVVVRPRDAVQWALYYPVIMDFEPGRFASLPAQWQQPLQQSLQAYRAGDVAAALERIHNLPANKAELFHLYIYRASLRLSVGRVEEAGSDLMSAASTDPYHSDVLALLSIIEVVQNQSERALELAKKAVAADEKNSAAALALSYAQQSGFDVEAALATLQAAVASGPDDALLWARLAELYLSVGDLGQALDAARQAVQMNPGLARTQSVLGFAYLTRIRIGKAKEAFERAIELDQTDPLSRLGLGLAFIRRGKLEQGRGQIELAASLDPNNSLIRSYLGKAYFDEKRDSVAATELAMAKQLDPNDPTPWFYDAIRKQTVNRPVEALQDLQRSIELNNNRAVFRSKFLLDEDLAVRSASLARIYDDLGFDQLALTEGWKSVNTDPGNFSAHRFLADAYAGRSRHETARVSELLQSQLLQPLNITPLQPRLAESNLPLLQGQGPASPAFNEFNPLFVRNRLALQASGVAGNKDTWGDEVTQSGIWNNISYSLGQLHFESDGFRNNNDQDTDLYNAFFQTSISPKLSLQAEYRHRDTDHGDLALNWDLDSFDSVFKRDLRTDTYRLGGRFAPTPVSDIIASFIYQDEKEKQAFEFFDTRTDVDGYLAEGQYLFSGTHFDMAAGISYYDADEDVHIGSVFDSSDENTNTQHRTAYVYSHLDFPRNISLTLGGSFDSLDDELIEDQNQFNPKLGLMWEVRPDTLVRVATFRVLKRTLLTDQTIEPTQVAGFNQFFDDRGGTDAWRYGIAVDRTFSQELYGGIEYSRRDLDVPIVSTGDITDDWQEDLVNVYLNWAPHPRYAASVAFQFEDFDADASDISITDTRTRLLPVDLRYFHPSGLFAGLTTTYVKQDAHFPNTLFASSEKDDDQFTLVDIAAGYRLPRRYGILTLGVRNVFDKSFNYQGLGLRTLTEENPPFLPERTYAARLTVSF